VLRLAISVPSAGLWPHQGVLCQGFGSFAHPCVDPVPTGILRSWTGERKWTSTLRVPRQGAGFQMAGNRQARIVAAVEAKSGGDWSPARLCEVTPEIVGVAGAGAMLMSGDLPQGSLCTTNSVSSLIDELQFTLGEGPCIDSYHRDEVVLEPDLAHPVTPRWFAFTPRALEAGIRAIFGFPLSQGAARLGAMHLYQSQPGHLTDDQHADALVMAQVIAQQVISAQAGALPGSVAEDLEMGADFHSIVHNAAGIVSVQLGIGVTEALVRLRAYAFSENRLVRDVADDVVTRRLTFQ